MPCEEEVDNPVNLPIFLGISLDFWGCACGNSALYGIQPVDNPTERPRLLEWR